MPPGGGRLRHLAAETNAQILAVVITLATFRRANKASWPIFDPTSTSATKLVAQRTNERHRRSVAGVRVLMRTHEESRTSEREVRGNLVDRAFTSIGDLWKPWMRSVNKKVIAIAPAGRWKGPMKNCERNCQWASPGIRFLTIVTRQAWQQNPTRTLHRLPCSMCGCLFRSQRQPEDLRDTACSIETLHLPRRSEGNSWP